MCIKELLQILNEIINVKVPNVLVNALIKRIFLWNTQQKLLFDSPQAIKIQIAPVCSESLSFKNHTVVKTVFKSQLHFLLAL